MEPDQILTLLSIGAIILGALFWIIDSRLGKVLNQFKPNGGTSVKDQLDRIESKIDGHLNWHLDRSN
jgi:hypothetical protein